ncbi:sugar-binding transcriptional regulator [Agrobacterium tumefaciens]|uniref:sugar-binding transcriptional regulator n=1 Tax=Agrobacterium tumefaciens TaxID=358 RepID=UPI003CE5B88E
MKSRPERSKPSSVNSLRVRAAWLYHVHGLTQHEVADRLGLSRTTVIRLLDEAKKLHEVTVWVGGDEDECVALSLEIENVLGVEEAIVVPSTQSGENAQRAVGAALGQFLSETISDGMSVGVGWGRTLNASLDTFKPLRREGVSVVSLLGGSINPSQINPVEYSWRLSSLLGASCFLFLSPLIVDSKETKERLFDRCGLDRLLGMARNLDLAVVSCGSLSRNAASLAVEHMSTADVEALRSEGCVGDVMCNFLDRQGNSVGTAINDRVMSVDLDVVASAKHVVLATGGTERAEAMIAAIRRLRPQTIITDEFAAKAMTALLRN